MAITVKENTKDSLKIEILDGDQTLANALKEEMWNDKGVKISGYGVKHSLADNPVLVVKGKEPKKILLNAVKRCTNNNKEFLSEFKKALKQ